jgi:glycosyltransferase involved in cell wall biosynthesis
LKKILLISHSSDASGGGEEDYLKLLKYLFGKYYIVGIFPEGDRTNQYIEYCNEYKIINSTVFPFTEFSLRKYAAYIFRNTKKMFQLYSFISKLENIDVCYINSAVCFLDALLVYLFGIPYILSVKEKINPFLVRKILAKLYRMTSERIIAISLFLKSEYEKADSKTNITIIHSALDEHYYEKVIKEIADKPGIENKFTVLNIGSIFYQKEQHLLIDAIKLCEDVSDFEVKIIGEIKDNKYFDFLKKKTDNDILKNVISFCGKLDKNEVIYEILNSNAVIITSFEEGQSLVLLESLYLGKAVISSNVGIVPEIIRDRINGIIFRNNDHKDLADKIKFLKSNRTLCENIWFGSYDVLIMFLILLLPYSLINFAGCLYLVLMVEGKGIKLLILQSINFVLITIFVFLSINLFNNYLGIMGFYLATIITVFLIFYFLYKYNDFTFKPFLLKVMFKDLVKLNIMIFSEFIFYKYLIYFVGIFMQKAKQIKLSI